MCEGLEAQALFWGGGGRSSFAGIGVVRTGFVGYWTGYEVRWF